MLNSRSLFRCSILPAYVAVALLSQGCVAEPAKNRSESKTENIKEELPKVDAVLPQPADLSVSLSDHDRPATYAEFEAEFRRLFSRDPFRPFIELGYWENSTDRNKRLFLVAVQSLFTNSFDATVGTLDESEPNLQFQDIEGYEWAYYPKEGDPDVTVVPEPVAVITITSRMSANTRKSQTFAVGRHEDKLYFSTVDGEWSPDWEEEYRANNPLFNQYR